jgi:hypothetical protein
VIGFEHSGIARRHKCTKVVPLNILRASDVSSMFVLGFNAIDDELRFLT